MELDDRFGADLTEDDKVMISHVEEKFRNNKGLAACMKVNPPENARLTFNHVVNDVMQDVVETNFKFYKRVSDDVVFANALYELIFDRYRGLASA